MLKRIMALMLAVVIVFGVTGCKKDSTSGKDTLSIEMMLLGGGNEDENYMIKKIFKEKFDIDLKINQNIESSHFEKLKLLIASNELPDIVSPLPIDDAKTIGVKGALVPIDEYLDIMPNLQKYLKKDKVAYTSLLASDSHIYGLPKFNERQEYMNTPIIRADMLKAVGMENPTTMAELKKVLKAIKKKFPDTLGVVSRSKESAFNAYGIMYNTNSGMMYNKETDKWEYGPLNKGYKEMITDLNELHSEGLLDEEFFTSSAEQWEEKLLNNKGVFTLDWPNRAQVEEDLYKKLHPKDKDFDLELLMPITTNSAPDMRILWSEDVASYSSFGISSKTKDVERLLKAIDYLYSDEGAQLLQWGKEGEHFVYENGQKKYKEHIKVSYNPNATVNIDTAEGINSGHIMRVVKNDGINIFPEEVQKMSVKYQESAECFVTNQKIKLNFTTEQQDRIRVLNNNIATLVQEESVKMVMNLTPISKYDSFIKKIEKDAKEMEKIYAAAYKEFKKQLKEVD